jgi:hypothetical protein
MRNKMRQETVWVRIRLTPKQQELLHVITDKPAATLEIPLPALKAYLRVCSDKLARACVFTTSRSYGVRSPQRRQNAPRGGWRKRSLARCCSRLETNSAVTGGE